MTDETTQPGQPEEPNEATDVLEPTGIAEPDPDAGEEATADGADEGEDGGL